MSPSEGLAGNRRGDRLGCTLRLAPYRRGRQPFRTMVYVPNKGGQRKRVSFKGKQWKYKKARVGTAQLPCRSVGFTGRFKQPARAETLFLDSDMASIDLNTTYAVPAVWINNLFTIPQGNGQSERRGRQIAMTQLRVNFSMYSKEAEPVMCRVLMGIDKQTNGAATTYSDVVETTSTDAFHGKLNLENIHRYEILKDKRFVLQPNGDAVGPMASAKTVRWNIHFNQPRYVRYNSSATTGALATIESGNIFLLVFAFQGTATGPATTATAAYITGGGARLRYQDMQ